MTNQEFNSYMNFLGQFCNFKDPGAPYILLMLPRKKENKDQTEKTKLSLRKRYVVRNLHECSAALKEFAATAQAMPDVTFRVYVSANRRSMARAMFKYQQELNKMVQEFAFADDKDEFWQKNPKGMPDMKSVLANKSCRTDKNFMFDVDLPNYTAEGVKKFFLFLEELKEHTTVLKWGNSRTGFWVVSKPFNPNAFEWDKDIEHKADSYVYVACLNG